MSQAYWHKQDPQQPLFPELLWSRPEHKAQAGKLLIVGGNSWGFAAPAVAYESAVKAGVGSARVLLPAAVHKLIGHTLEHAESVASTPSGSFATAGLNEWLEQAAWADGVLVAGDLSRNSETAIVLQQFLDKFQGQVTLAKDAVDYAVGNPKMIQSRPQTCVVLSLAQLQKLAIAYGFDQPITFSMDLLQLAAALHELTTKWPLAVVTRQQNVAISAADGLVSGTNLAEADSWRVPTAAQTSVWWLQNPTRTFEALTSALINVE